MENKTTLKGINSLTQYQSEKRSALASTTQNSIIDADTLTKALAEITKAQQAKRSKKDIGRLAKVEIVQAMLSLGRPVAETIVDILFPTEKHTNIDGEDLNKMTLDRLIHMPFYDAHKYVMEKSTSEERLQWGDEAAEYLAQLYELTKLYGNNRSPKDMENGVIHMSPEEFQRLLNKIKHIESVLSWFYETDMTWLDEDTLNLELEDI